MRRLVRCEDGYFRVDLSREVDNAMKIQEVKDRYAKVLRKVNQKLRKEKRKAQADELNYQFAIGQYMTLHEVLDRMDVRNEKQKKALKKVCSRFRLLRQLLRCLLAVAQKNEDRVLSCNECVFFISHTIIPPRYSLPFVFGRCILKGILTEQTPVCSRFRLQDDLI